ncbi:DNA repair protein RAD51 homolog 2-like [Dipodomys spectabilis]|uniref:DNA repair protein RAD51 homolog 2-like n=1 Tax=Dipodomys spectabilis TaxID=105255 RepID=UPI001C535779|nr:DNA repair protein RAD51 homolog 2-like [Dipodomys spectabilis]
MSISEDCSMPLSLSLCIFKTKIKTFLLTELLDEVLSCLVILTNQITTHLSGARAAQADLVSPADDLSLTEGTSGSSCVVAALGNTWSHSVNTRLILQHLDSERKQILIAKSPLAPFTSFAYSIKEEGLVLQG